MPLSGREGKDRSMTILGYEPGSSILPAPVEHEAHEVLDESREAWLWLKAGCMGRYVYTRCGLDGERLGAWTTTLVVVGERVIERHFEQSWFDEELLDIRSIEWVEKGDDVGSHSEGAPPRTIDQLYDDAERGMRTAFRAGEDAIRLELHASALLRRCEIGPQLFSSEVIDIDSFGSLAH